MENIKNFNKMYEFDRIKFIALRDGKQAAIDQAKQIIKVYLATVRHQKKNLRTKNHPYRSGYVESAYSARYILQSGLIDQMI